MPELPEVETVCSFLREKIAESRITAIKINRPSLRRPINLEKLLQCQNLYIQQIERRAKYIRLILSENKEIVLHLGMTGLILYNSSNNNAKHNHIVFTLDNKNHLIFNDTRRFGMVIAMERNHDLFKDVGIEPLDGNLSPNTLMKIMKNCKSPIKVALMDGSKIAGIGNIYAAEILFEARVSPLKTAQSLCIKEAGKLVKSIQSVLERSIALGGSSIKDYLSPGQKPGYFQNTFHVYNRHNKPCTHCHEPIQKTQQAGRSTFYCQHCQT